MRTAVKYALVGIVVLALLGCAIYILRQSRNDAEAVRKIENLGGSVRNGGYGRCIDLCFFEITDADLPILAELKKPRMLDLRYSQVSDRGLAIVGAMSALTYLNLSNTQIGGQGLARLRQLRLHGLELSNTPINDADLLQLAGMTSLRQLTLCSTNVSDQSVAVLGKLSALQCLNIAGTKITAAGVSRIQQLLPQVQIVGGGKGDQALVDSGLTFPGAPSWAASNGRRTLRKVKRMQSPVVLAETAAFADGGTLGARLRDATGQELLFCFSSDEGWDDFKASRAYVGGIYPVTPGARLLPLDGKELPLLIQLLQEGIANAAKSSEKGSMEYENSMRCGTEILRRLRQLAETGEGK